MSNDNKLVNNLQHATAAIDAGAKVVDSLVSLFTHLAKMGDAMKDLSMPNFQIPTMGGHVFWNELANVNGWRLQKNMFTGHCRILDPDDVRRAWGGEDALTKALRQLAK